MSEQSISSPPSISSANYLTVGAGPMTRAPEPQRHSRTYSPVNMSSAASRMVRPVSASDQA